MAFSFFFFYLRHSKRIHFSLAYLLLLCSWIFSTYYFSFILSSYFAFYVCAPNVVICALAFFSIFSLLFGVMFDVTFGLFSFALFFLFFFHFSRKQKKLHIVKVSDVSSYLFTISILFIAFKIEKYRIGTWHRREQTEHRIKCIANSRFKDSSEQENKKKQNAIKL